MPDKFEWDGHKRLANASKHGIDFTDAVGVFEGDIVIMLDDRFDYGETRYTAYGLLHGKVIVVSYTERGERIRLISARKAVKDEEIHYFKEIAD